MYYALPERQHSAFCSDVCVLLKAACSILSACGLFCSNVSVQLSAATYCAPLEQNDNSSTSMGSAE
jgi:hypothetical protein